MLHAYFNESGTHERSIITAIGGYVGDEARWTAMEAEWLAVLMEVEGLGIRSFHLSECLMADGQFARCEQPIRNYLVNQLSRILGRHALHPLYAAVVQDDWDELNDGSAFFLAFPSPIALCFETIVRELALWAEKNANGEEVAPVFAYRTEWSTGGGLGAPILQLYGSQPWYRKALAAIAFAWPDKCIPLQGADMIAGLSRMDVEARSGESWCGSSVAFDQAKGGKFPAGGWYDRDALAVAIKRFHQTGSVY